MINWVPNKTIDEKRIHELLQESLATNQFTNGGPVVSKLESAIRTLLQIDSSKSIIAVSNGTVALWAVVAALELFLHFPLRFATQSFTFPASAQGVLKNVEIIDIDKDGGIDLNLISPDSVDGIIVTNVFGNLVDIQKYESWAKKHSKYLIFDNAATAFTSYNKKNSCNYGIASTLSFHHTKPIGFGEGGAIIIDSQYERTLRNIINFGIDNTNPVTAKWNRLGGNYKMSDLQAAYILQYFEKVPFIKCHHQNLFSYFTQKIQYVKGISLFPNFSDEIPFVSCICIFSDHSETIIKELLNNNIYCRKYYNPLIPTPISSSMYNNIVCISCTVDMTIKDINTILTILQKYGES